MTWIRSSWKWTAVGFYLLATVTVHLVKTDSSFSEVMLGLGGVGVAVAAVWTVWLKAKEADRKAEALDRKLNGGLQSIAAQIMADELRLAGLEVGLGKRVEFLEEHYQDCLVREIESKAELRRWLLERLDETGNGRSEER
jgi:hypothetical protein